MSEEEIQAIKELKNHREYFEFQPEGCNWRLSFDEYEVHTIIDVVLNLIDRQQKELDKEKEKNKRNKKIILDKLDKLKNGIENDFPITLGERQPLWEENKTDYISKDKIRELPRTEYCNAECLMNGIYVDWDYIKELLEE